MPVISMFYDVIVMMYFFDDKQHHLPRIHVEYAEESAVLVIPSGDVLKGAIRSSRLKLVQAWIEIHQEELMANWTCRERRTRLPYRATQIGVNIMMIKVTAVEPLENHQLQLSFNTGDYLNKGIFTEFRDPTYFKSVRMAFGSIAWPNEQDLGPESLYVESRPMEATRLVRSAG